MYMAKKSLSFRQKRFQQFEQQTEFDIKIIKEQTKAHLQNPLVRVDTQSLTETRSDKESPTTCVI